MVCFLLLYHCGIDVDRDFYMELDHFSVYNILGFLIQLISKCYIYCKQIAM